MVCLKIIAGLEDILLYLNERLDADGLPQGMILRPDGDLVKPNADHTVGLSSSPERLERFCARFERVLGVDLSRFSVLDAGAFIGDAAAFFSMRCRAVTAVERDADVRTFALERQACLRELGYARTERIRWLWADYFSDTVTFGGHDLVYNYFDQYNEHEGRDVLAMIMDKFSREADEDAFLVFQVYYDDLPCTGPLVHRTDLSAGDFQVFQRRGITVR